MRASAAAVQLHAGFDPLPVDRPATMRTSFRVGRVVRYIDDGEPVWRPIVFFGGLGTSARAYELTEFARTLRARLALRIISVERNGFGQTPFDPSLGRDDAVDDVLAVLDELGVERVVVIAFSGGGPYAAALAARAPGRVVSLHLAAAAAGAPATVGGAFAAAHFDPTALARSPSTFWQLPSGSPLRRVPGFLDAANLEGVRALGRDGRAAQALAHEWQLLRTEPLPDMAWVTAPAYLYWGTDDDVVLPAHVERWRRALHGSVTLRRYSGEGHDVQYRHWDQILVDAAGLGPRTLICDDGRTAHVDSDLVDRRLAAGASPGLCAWRLAADPEPARRAHDH
jgi:non-heme chloroperoxidase